MEQKMRKAKPNPLGDGDAEETAELPTPPEIDDLLKAAENALNPKKKIKDMQTCICGFTAKSVCHPVE